jgi:hypothetical protein
MKQDKFLTGILIGIGALIVLALALFFVRQGGTEYVADSTPEGVVHNYVVAVLDKDYEKAYTYLADLENKPSYEEFRNSFLHGVVNPADTGLEVGRADINNDTASVELTIYYSYGDPFSLNTGSKDHAALVKQEGTWKISYMTYNYWAYEWYQKPYSP